MRSSSGSYQNEFAFDGNSLPDGQGGEAKLRTWIEQLPTVILKPQDDMF